MNQGAGTTQTYVIHVENRVIGYYSLRPASIARESAIRRILEGIAGHAAIPIILLARLAVDSNEQNKGLGPALPKDAFQGAINAGVASGSTIVVHAIGDDIVRFYEHFNFAPSPNDDRTLMILMKDLRAKLGTPPKQAAQPCLE